MVTASVLFVCMGNICRSPAAEGVLQHVAMQRGIPVEVDSAATHSYHVGETADRRMIAAAKRRGIELTSRARVVTAADLQPGRFDVVIAMDDANLHELKQLHREAAAGFMNSSDESAASQGSPTGSGTRRPVLASDKFPTHVGLLSDYLGADDHRTEPWPREVPDPYYGGEDGFDFVLDMLQAACPAILDRLTDATD